MKQLPTNAKPILLPFFFFLLSFVLFSCSEPNDPPDPPDNEPDTTSHEFCVEKYELGLYGRINDVEIINENSIWAVGEIFTEYTYTYDSLGNWISIYNAAH